MSWHYLQGQEAVSWEGNSLDGAPSALLKLIPTPGASCSPDKPTDASSRSPFGMTLRRSTGTRGAEGLTWFQGDSPVRTYRQPAEEQDLTENGLDCGPRWPGSLARFNPDLCSWKTRQCSLFGGLTEFLGTWPRWGMMRDGELFLRETSVHRICENESGLWPTPVKSDAMSFDPKTMERKEQTGKRPSGCKIGKSLKWDRRAFPYVSLGKINPILHEWLMGWPIGWTDCTAPATARCQLASPWHGRHSLPKMMVDWLAAHGIVLETVKDGGFQHGQSRET